MVRISFVRPTTEDQRRFALQSSKKAIKSARLGPNHSRIGYTQRAPLSRAILRQESWHEIDTFVILGEGVNIFNKAKSALMHWDHFRLDWAVVDSETPLYQNHPYCNLTKVLVPWVTNPVRIEYVEDIKHTDNGGKSFAFGTTTLQGHVLAGEERFRIDWNKQTNAVKYEIYSFSKPGHILGWIGYPIVRLLQASFVRESLHSMKSLIND